MNLKKKMFSCLQIREKSGYISGPTVFAHPITEMGSKMRQLYYCYGPHYKMGVENTLGQGTD